MSIPKKNLPPKIAPRTPGGSPKYASRDVLLTRADRMRAERDKAVAELARLRGAVDAFFDGVMVNAEDPALKANRLGLLATLHAAMNRVADLSKLAA